MKRSNDEIYLEETKRKEIKLTETTYTSYVRITLDESIGSKLLKRKFKYQTTELQLFLQNAPILYWYPLQITGTRFETIDACVFSAAIRNNFHGYSTYDMVESMLVDLVLDDDDSMFPPREYKLTSLLQGLLNDQLFMLQALQEYRDDELDDGMDYSNPLEYASDQLTNDEKFMLKAMKISSDSIDYASDRLLDDASFLSLAKQHSEDVPVSSDTREERYYENGRMQVVEPIEKFSIKYASKRLKDNESFILQAIKKNGNLLQFASDRLKDNEEIVLEAAKQNSYSFKYASERLRNDFNFAKEILKYCTTLHMFKYFGEALRNIEFIHYVVETYPSRLHELVRNNTVKANSNVMSSLEILSELHCRNCE